MPDQDDPSGCKSPVESRLGLLAKFGWAFTGVGTLFGILLVADAHWRRIIAGHMLNIPSAALGDLSGSKVFTISAGVDLCVILVGSVAGFLFAGWRQSHHVGIVATAAVSLYALLTMFAYRLMPIWLLQLTLGSVLLASFALGIFTQVATSDSSKANGIVLAISVAMVTILLFVHAHWDMRFTLSTAWLRQHLPRIHIVTASHSDEFTDSQDVHWIGQYDDLVYVLQFDADAVRCVAHKASDVLRVDFESPAWLRVPDQPIVD